MAHLRSFDGVHELHYLGVADLQLVGVLDGGVSASTSKKSTTTVEKNVEIEEEFVRSIEERIIDQLDYMQMCGELPRSPAIPPSRNAHPEVGVHVSVNGIKLIDMASQRVVERVAMHKIVQCLAYDNDFGGVNVAVVVAVRPDAADAVCHLLQTENSVAADEVCAQMREAFAQIHTEANSRAKAERQIHADEEKRHRRAFRNR